MVYRIYVEKKHPFTQEAAKLLTEFRELLGIKALNNVRILKRYDVEGISAEQFAACQDTVFSEPPLEVCYTELPKGAAAVIAREFQPGQFDQLADSCAQCIQFITKEERPLLATALVFLLYGDLSHLDIAAIKKYLINPVECREAALALPNTLKTPILPTEQTPLVDNFLQLDENGLNALTAEYGLAMDLGDLLLCKQYFSNEGRCPTCAELRIIDTYWSDHCRHTTFNTELTAIELEDEQTAAAYNRYQALRHELGVEKPVTLMDMATIGARYLRRQGLLPHLEESEEVNACTVKVDIDVNGKEEPWLLFFKNETHNHPTEIEPFGGASTCLGGGLRDPLSGRGYPYQAMRITGAGDPTVPLAETLSGKLPQRKLTTTAAAGHASYANQIGVAAGLGVEIYHPGYIAKRMEAGAVVAAAPLTQVRHEKPLPKDKVLLVGGLTGRDGCGGATGSSKTQDTSALTTLGAEVQKGNAPEERKILRLFRNPKASVLIKRCNDFGAGGVSVAIGELASGLDIDVDAVPVKYPGLTGTELAISESQERMAVVLAPGDVATFMALAEAEGLQATIVAEVTDSGRMVIHWQGQVIADIARAFLDSNGSKKYQPVLVKPGQAYIIPAQDDTLENKLHLLMDDLNICSQRGIGERFDSTAGAGTVLMPLGGKRQLTPIQAMAAKLPVKGETTSCTLMSYGFDPYISSASPYNGAYLAVIESVAKLIATGGELNRCWLSFQEFFPKLGKSPERWGLPVAALLGALSAQLDLGLAAIGGKDSMSGSYEQIDVPPTLISFAIAMADTDHIVSPEFKKAGSRVVLLKPVYESNGLPQAESLQENFNTVVQLIREDKVSAACALAYGGAAAGLIKMCLGNNLGLQLAPGIVENELFNRNSGSFLIELKENAQEIGLPIGFTIEEYELHYANEIIALNNLEELYENRLKDVFPTNAAKPLLDDNIPAISYERVAKAIPHTAIARPRVLIPALPGSNCEYDLAYAFAKVGADPHIVVVRNLTPSWLSESISNIAKELNQSHILALPGDYYGGGEAEGCGKFIANFFRHTILKEALQQLLEERNGLILGVGSGFMGLLKLGLLPFGKVCDISPQSPALANNTIGRHQSRLVHIRVASALSPWLSLTKVGDIHSVALSHSEGRLVLNEELFKQLASQGQIVSQYVDLKGCPSMVITANPTGSYMAVEALCSPDGRILGQMTHPERWSKGNMQNVAGNKYYPIFEGAMHYFK
ncbi:MAG: phosphoribosylformylglycinamidine synthase [Firmicutes bacterium]|nr:phosphoribosylformylglycinamidine synthase [Bacillota bacterium]